jgi:uncharacterized membrane protein YdjX (TVP38/TMEM64 family)
VTKVVNLMDSSHLNLKVKETLFSIILIVALAGLILIMFIDLIPVLKNVVAHIKNEKELTTYISNYGSKGVLIIIALQALQVITAIFPAAAVQILAGLSYGIFYGMLSCIIGYILGNSIVFVIVRQIDKTFMPVFPKLRKRKNKKAKWDFSFLKESKHAALMAFILFLIPGIPNGILPYLFAHTKISLNRYLLSIILAGIPSILVCSIIGERISIGDTTSALLIFCFLLLIAFLVLLFRKRVITLIREKSN